jgi:hypothetical protein
MSIKTSKIKEVVKVSEPYGQFKTLYHKLIMENGDKLDIGKVKEQQAGWELTYEITGDLGQQEYTKAKTPKKDWNQQPVQSIDNNTKKSDTVQSSIEKQCALKEAVNYCKSSECGHDNLYFNFRFNKYLLDNISYPSDEEQNKWRKESGLPILDNKTPF